ncbi:MAG: FecR domain-containing protein [Gemmatimonadaceae bacterium]|nr:FecR domain-containing protein [Gemmatimonadaceae bacterium]
MTHSLDLQHLDDDARWALLARHVAGEATPVETAAVEAWLAADASRAQALAAVRAAAGETAWATPAGVDVEAALAKVHTRMRAPQAAAIGSAPSRAAGGAATQRTATQRTATPDAATPGTASSMSRRWVPLAAAATLVLAAGLGWFLRAAPAAPSPARTVATAVGQRDSLDLPDGTRVILGPASRLEIAAGFAEGTREVRVEGEAVFSVVHDAAHPFTVLAGAARIVDVGTAFTVRHAPGDVEVAVLEGVVDIGVAGGATARLAAGDRALVSSGAPVVRRGDVTAEDGALRRGALVFREAPMARVTADLARWYGVRVVPATAELAARHVTATFTTEGRDEAVALLALALGAAAEAHGDSIVLRPRTLRSMP